MKLRTLIACMDDDERVVVNTGSDMLCAADVETIVDEIPAEWLDYHIENVRYSSAYKSIWITITPE